VSLHRYGLLALMAIGTVVDTNLTDPSVDGTDRPGWSVSLQAMRTTNSVGLAGIDPTSISTDAWPAGTCTR
jgi:hypothetical protein